MSRKLDDLSHKTLAELREIKAQVCANIRKAIINAVSKEEDTYGIQISDLDVLFDRNTMTDEQGEEFISRPDCEVSIGIRGSEL